MKNMRKLMLLTLLCALLTTVLAFGTNAVTLPETPTGLEAECDKNSVELNWDDSFSADGYLVFVRQDDDWILLSDEYYSDCTVSDLTPGTSYTFAVRAYAEDYGTQYYSTDFAIITVTTDPIIPETPTGFDAEYCYLDHIDLRWDDYGDADGYRIFVRQNGKWVTLDDVYYMNYCTIEDLTPGTSYTFAVRAFVLYDGIQYWSPAFATVRVTTDTPDIPDTPTGLVAYYCDFDYVDLEWDYDYDADGYRVFVKENGKWVILDDVTYGYYQVTGLTPGTSYTFAVRAYAEYNGKLFWSPGFATVRAKTDTIYLPDTPTNLHVYDRYADSIELDWDYDDYADGYRVFISQNGKWEKLADVDYSDYTVEDLTASTNYRFAVRAFVERNEELYWSKSFATINAVTEDMDDYFYASAEEHGTKVTLSWDSEKGASGYRIFRYVSGKWKKVKDVSKKYDSYTVENLEIGKTYYFAVRPYAKTDRGVVWGDLSNTCKIKTTDPYTVKITSCTEKEKSVALKWKQVEAATGYRVYMYTGGKWKAIKTLAPKTSTSYTITGLKSDTKYTLAVRAYTKKNGVTTWHPYKSFKAITLPSESDLSLYRIAAYDKKFQKNYLLEMTVSTEYYTNAPCYYASKKGFLSTDDFFIGNGRGVSRYIYDPNSKNLYWIYDEGNGYGFCEREKGWNFSSISPWSDPKDREDYDVYITKFNGETVVCESFYDAYYGDYYECYFKAGELVGFTYEVEYPFEGDWGGIYTVTNFTTNVPDSYFILPKGYTIYG